MKSPLFCSILSCLNLLANNVGVSPEILLHGIVTPIATTAVGLTRSCWRRNRIRSRHDVRTSLPRMTVESTNLPASVGARLLQYIFFANIRSSNGSSVSTNWLFCSQVAVDPRNYRVFVASTANDTLWVLNVVDEEGSEGGCAVLELQVKFAEPPMNVAGSSEGCGISHECSTSIHSPVCDESFFEVLSESRHTCQYWLSS